MIELDHCSRLCISRTYQVETMANNHLRNKRILLGITGSIAAYKSADIVRRAKEQGAEVRVVMTERAHRFITPLTLQAVSGNPVRADLFDEAAEAGMGHIELARWADILLIAPASAGALARLAHGYADDLLTTLCLATDAPIAVAPAMNRLMWSNPATQENMKVLESRGVSVLGPGVGDQACGETGPGRMLSPEEIIECLASMFSVGRLVNTNVLVTSGATWEAIDPVRGITNKSSGKMGHAIVCAAVNEGANVTLVSGPTSGPEPNSPANQVIRVTSAEEMQKAVLAHIENQQIFIGVAAVADYRPDQQYPEKIKKSDDVLPLRLVRNPDILAAVKKQNPGIFAVGFAAETSEVVNRGRRKLLSKGVDMIAANKVGGVDGAIGSDGNKIDLIDRTGVTTIGPDSKQQVANRLINEICERYLAEDSLQNTR